MSDKVPAVTDADFDREVLESPLPVLVDFWADWCMPCKRLAPMLDDMADEFAGELAIRKVDVEANPASRDRYGVRGLPTMILFRDGKEVTRDIGHGSRTSIAAAIEAALASAQP